MSKPTSSPASLSEADLDAAALRLSIEARELLGLPLGPHPSSPISTSSGPISWSPTILPTPPTPLQFHRLVSRSVPVLIQNCLTDRKAQKRWKDTEYLIDKMGERRVKVALDPNGRADDLVWNEEEGKEVFALPLDREFTFSELISTLTNPDPSAPIAYLQSQNNNLTSDSNSSHGDLSPLLSDLCRPSSNIDDHGSSDADTSGSPNSSPQALRPSSRTDLEWATEALGTPPQATNLWLGGSSSKSSMHRDHYENLFHVVRGTKFFTVYPPTEAWFLCDDEEYEVYEYVTSPSPPVSSSSTPSSSSPQPLHQTSTLRLSPLDPPSKTPWIPIDPTEPPTSLRNSKHQRFAKGLRALRIEVKEDQTLFLPAGWFHHVSQTADDRPYDASSLSLNALDVPNLSDLSLPSMDVLSLSPTSTPEQQQGSSTPKPQQDLPTSAPKAKPQGLCMCVNWWYESETAFGDRWALLEFVREVGRRGRGRWVDVEE